MSNCCAEYCRWPVQLSFDGFTRNAAPAATRAATTSGSMASLHVMTPASPAAVGSKVAGAPPRSNTRSRSNLLRSRSNDASGKYSAKGTKYCLS
jgi:hypothetical protein